MKTDQYGRVSNQFEIFADPNDLKDFNYFSLVMKVSYMEDGIKKSYKKSYSYRPERDDYEDKFKILNVVDVDGEKKIRRFF